MSEETTALRSSSAQCVVVVVVVMLGHGHFHKHFHDDACTLNHDGQQSLLFLASTNYIGAVSEKVIQPTLPLLLLLQVYSGVRISHIASDWRRAMGQPVLVPTLSYFGLSLL